MAPKKSGKMVNMLNTGSKGCQAVKNVSASGSSTAEIKGRNDTVDPNSREVGEDGHYFECVICDKVGKLICCDSCPSTYHLDCLVPPLETVPSGSWKCPACAENDNMLLPLKDFLKLSKRSKQNAKSSCKSKDPQTACSQDSAPITNCNEPDNPQNCADDDEMLLSLKDFLRLQKRSEQNAESSCKSKDPQTACSQDLEPITNCNEHDNPQNCAENDDMLLPLKDFLKLHKRSKQNAESSCKGKDPQTACCQDFEQITNYNEHEDPASAKATIMITYKRRKHLRNTKVDGKASG